MKNLIYKVLCNIKLASSNEFPFNIEIVAENLNVPWSIAISDNGTMYVSERTGAIRIIDNGLLLLQPLIRFRTPFIAQGEGGLLGIALDPSFLQNNYMYAMHSYSKDNAIFNRVVRLFVQNNRATIDEIIINEIPGSLIHNGGRIKIGPDNKLYVTTGDSGNSSLSQDINSLAGKILRINLDGSIPDDNPISNSLVYALGLRNPQGLAWSNNNMYATDHGSLAHDEINIIRPGDNYGWPLVQGDEESSEIDAQLPLIHSGNTTWAPSGLAYLSQGPWQGKLLVGCLRGQQLISITLNSNGTSIRNAEYWLKNQHGRLRDVIQSSDGSIYITTSNMDGRGGPVAGGDKIVRLHSPI